MPARAASSKSYCPYSVSLATDLLAADTDPKALDARNLWMGAVTEIWVSVALVIGEDFPEVRCTVGLLRCRFVAL